MMKAVSGGAVVGNVHMVVQKVDGQVVRELAFPNLVLDVGYKELIKRWASSGMSTSNRDTPRDLTTHLYLGTGTTEPTFLDSGLENRSDTLPGKAQNPGFHSNMYYPYDGGQVRDNDNNYLEAWYNFRYAYGEGEAEGVWTELGLSDNNYAFPFTRALIRDESGAPISLTILSDEYLTVFYKVRFINEPQDLGTITIDGVVSNVTFRPGNTVRLGLNSSHYRIHSYLPATSDGPLRIPAAKGSANYSYFTGVAFKWENGSYPGSVSGHLSPGLDYNVSGDIVFEPTDTDLPVDMVVLNNVGRDPGDTDGIFGGIIFDPPFNKRADYRVTIGIDFDFSPHDGPVTGLSETATATTLDFTWDAYPCLLEDGTACTPEYQLVLRQAGTVIEEQTVTTESASFTGLTADTEYHLDIKPIATPRNGRRLIYAATTGAA